MFFFGGSFRFFHRGLVSLIFLVLYIHIFRRIFYSLKNFTVWRRGARLFLVLMLISFLGYVLPWGQISFWGAAVITNFFSVLPWVGERVVFWVWGGFIVGGGTLKLFFILHFIFPFLCLVIIVWHLVLLHIFGSSRSGLGAMLSVKTVFFRKFFLKDRLILVVVEIGTFYVAFMFLVEEENFLEVDIVSSPLHIKPEWYFLFFYSLLRSLPSKVLGVVCMGRAIIILIILISRYLNYKISKIIRGRGWLLMFNFFFLSNLGGAPITMINEVLRQVLGALYFVLVAIFLLL